jgi:carbon monoxide dehydrogenase subunit G
MFMKILLVLAVVIVVFCVFVATRPSAFHIERSARIGAPPAAVFAQVNDFHRWDAWSPWAKMDPAMKATYSGAPAGEGAAYTWVGNSQVGEGKMTITESRPTDRITIRLEFLKPMAATNTATFTFKGNGAGTDVTWAMDGNNGFMGKAFSVFMNMDTMLGAYFEQGLGQMKLAAEHP